MKQLAVLVMAGGALLTTAPVQANNRTSVDVVVPLPAEAWQSGARNTQGDCLRCCVYQDKKYSEGAVLTVDGVVLQCVRDRQTVGTNDLIWQALKR